MEKTIVIIDAGFLSKLTKYFGGGKYLTYDLIAFSKNLAEKQKLACEHIYYYTAPPFKSNSPTSEESNRFRKYEEFKNKLSKYKILSIREGRCQRLKIDGNFVYNQKGVDALAIIDLMSIPLEHKDVKKVILIANDSDFVPVVEKLKQLNIEVILHTFYSKKRESSFSRSNELLKMVSRYVQLTTKKCSLRTLRGFNPQKAKAFPRKSFIDFRGPKNPAGFFWLGSKKPKNPLGFNPEFFRKEDFINSPLNKDIKK